MAEGAGFAVNASHTYATDGTFPLVVTIAGTGGSAASGGRSITVADAPLTPIGRTFVATANQPFSGVVASFDDTQVPPGSAPGDFQATIAWGDGDVTTGTVTSSTPGRLDVSGDHTYVTAGPRTADVTIVRAASGQRALASSQVTVAPAATLRLVGTTLTPVVNQPFSGVVATLFDSDPASLPNDFAVTIDWGDGQTTPGDLRPVAAGQFEVAGTHTYTLVPDPGRAVTVRVARLADGQAVSASTTLIVALAPPIEFTGRLDPLTDLGVSNTDGITRTNQPAFLGTAAPNAIVRLFARRADQAEPFSLGEVIASPAGLWSLTTDPLADGVYAITAVVIPPGGFPQTRTLLTSNSEIRIDTVAPRVAGLASLPSSRQVRVVFVDNLSGFDDATLTDRAAYTLIGRGRNRTPIAVQPGLRPPDLLPTDPRGVVLTTGAGLRPRAIRISSRRITDVAGNALAPGVHRALFQSLARSHFFAKLPAPASPGD